MCQPFIKIQYQNNSQKLLNKTQDFQFLKIDLLMNYKRSELIKMFNQ
jgi:hypothetical protein